LVWYEGSGTGDRRFLHADERGSIVAVTDSAGNAIGINRYDEYGVPASTNIGRFQYTGQTWLPELGMYNYKNRIYDPKLRFVQPDPIGYAGGMNLYVYPTDPVNFTDPWGLEEEPPIVVTSKCPRGTYQNFLGACAPNQNNLDLLDRARGGGSGGATGGGPGGSGQPAPPKPQNNQQCPSVPARRDVGNTGLVGAAVRDPTGIIIAGEVRGLANEASRAQFPSLSSSGTARDAFRHFYGAFALTRLIGPTRALNILNAVEVSGGNSAANRNMDTFNNYVAIRMAQDPRSQGRSTADMANAALAQGCLKVNRRFRYSLLISDM
jgi:RHS repeat-associated protein